MLTAAIRSFTAGRGPLLACLLLSLLASFIPPTTAASVNVTVDDTYGSNDKTVIPVYSPNNASWHLGSPTEQCTVCAIKPSEFDTSQIYDQTWHHATYFVGIPVQVSVTFHGTAVYVYNVIPNYLKGANTYVNLAFAIDGVTVGHFTHTPDSSGTILYNHLVYSTTGLSNAEHTLVMSASGSQTSLIFFDYLIYTMEDDATTSGAASSSASPSAPANTNTLALPVSSTTPGTSASSASSSSNSNSASTSGSSSSSSGSASSFGSSNTALPASAAASTALVSPSSSSSAALDTASSSHSNTAAIAGGVVGGVLILLVAPTLFFLIFCRQRRRRQSAIIDPYKMNGNGDGDSSAMPPLMAGLPGRPVSDGIYYSSHATGNPSLASPTITSPVSSARTFDTKRELELKRRMEELQREMAAHQLLLGHSPPDSHSDPRSPDTLLGSDLSGFGSGSGMGSTSGESRVSMGAVQALQEEIAALRGVLSGMTAHVGGGHNQPAMCESEILPGYEEARWSAAGNVGSGISGLNSRW